MNHRRILAAVGLLLVLAVLGGVMRSQIPPRIDLPFDLTSTTLAAEFASTPVEINQVLGSGRTYVEPLRRQQYFDFLFIAAYVGLFVILALALRSYDIPGARGFAWAALVCAIAGGLFDVAENLAILRTLAAPNALTSNVRMFSIPKWALAFAVLILESAVFFFWPRLNLPWRIASGIVGGLMLFAGASGLLFSLLVSITDIEWSAGWMTYALIGMLLFLVGRLLAPRFQPAARRLRY